MQDDNINYEELVHKQLDDILKLIEDIKSNLKGE